MSNLNGISTQVTGYISVNHSAADWDANDYRCIIKFDSLRSAQLFLDEMEDLVSRLKEAEPGIAEQAFLDGNLSPASDYVSTLPNTLLTDTHDNYPTTDEEPF